MPEDISSAELEWWVKQPPPFKQRIFHPGCLIIVVVCVIIWLAAILGAVQLYKRSPLDPVIVTPPSTSTGSSSTTVIAPEDLDR